MNMPVSDLRGGRSGEDEDVGAGGVARRRQQTLAALLLLHLHRVGHDVDGGVELERDEAGARDARHLGAAQHAAQLASLLQLRTALL